MHISTGIFVLWLAHQNNQQYCTTLPDVWLCMFPVEKLNPYPFVYQKLDKGTPFIVSIPQDISIEQGWDDQKWRNIEISAAF